MTTYLDVIAQRANARTHHAFILHGGTRDLQLGSNGSCSLTDHLVETFASLNDGSDPRLVAIYRAGIGWRFAVASDSAEFKRIVGLESAKQDDFAEFNSAGNDDGLPLDPGQAIALFDVAMRQTDRKIVCVIDRAELVCPSSGYDRMSPADKASLSQLQAIASDREVEYSGNLFFLITDTLVELADSLRFASSRYYAIEIAPPDYAERLTIANQVLPQLANSGVEVELTGAQFASATSMMTRYALMDCLRDAQQANALTKEQVRAVKAQTMSQEYGDVLESLEPLERGFDDIAGLDALKEFFGEIAENMIGNNFGDVPTGVLLAGAPGLGKSFFVRGYAGECGLPVINFNIGKLLGSYVGQSEKNLERALTAIRSAAPCVVCIDEIETAFPDRANAGPSGDSGVSSRILKRMLEELSNPNLRGRVLWIGITNYPNKLDSALARPGRFDATVAFLPPTETERIELLALYARKYGAEYPTAQTLQDIARKLEGYTNAEVENVVRKARQVISRTKPGNQQNLDACWIDASNRVRANTRGVAEMTQSALLAVNDADLLPVEYIDRWRRLTNQEKPIDQGAVASNKRSSLF